jgi:hypothetical protein
MAVLDKMRVRRLTTVGKRIDAVVEHLLAAARAASSVAVAVAKLKLSVAVRATVARKAES